MANDETLKMFQMFDELYGDTTKQTLEETLRSMERKGIIRHAEYEDTLRSFKIPDHPSDRTKPREQEIPLYENTDGIKGNTPEELLECSLEPNRYSKYFEYAKRIYRTEDYYYNLWDLGDKSMLNILIKPKVRNRVKNSHVIDALLELDLQPRIDVIQRMWLCASDLGDVFSISFAYLHPLFLSYFRSLLILVMEMMGMDYKYYYKIHFGIASGEDGTIYNPILQLITMVEDVSRHFSMANVYLNCMDDDVILFNDLHEMLVAGYRFFKSKTNDIISKMVPVFQPNYEYALYSGDLYLMSAIDSLWYATYLSVAISSHDNISHANKGILLTRTKDIITDATRLIRFKGREYNLIRPLNIRERLYIDPLTTTPFLWKTFNRELFEKFESEYITKAHIIYGRSVYRWGEYYEKHAEKRPSNPNHDGITTVLE